LSLPLLVWEEYSSALLLAIKRLRTYNFLQLIGRTAGLVGVSVLVLGVGAGVIGVLLATLLGQVIIAAGAFAYLASEVWGRGQKIAAQRVELLGLLAGGIRLHFNAVGTVLFSSTGVLILNHYRGPAETAYYQLAVQLVGALMVFPQAASLAIYEKVVALGADGAWRLHRRVLLRILIGIVVLCAIVGMSAPVWLVALAGEPFRPAVEIFQWMLLGVIGMAFSAIMAPQWIVRGYFVQASALTLTVGIASFTTSLFLIPRWGLHGAVFAFLGTYFISVLANAVMAFHCESCARRDAS
jgi:O-antigen/teichoic acid export membrane protein